MLLFMFIVYVYCLCLLFMFIVYVYCLCLLFMCIIWESPPLAESNRFGKSVIDRKYSV